MILLSGEGFGRAMSAKTGIAVINRIIVMVLRQRADFME
jgi:hypothetical protein